MITNHRFVGRRQDGIYGAPTTPCQTCGWPKSQHAESCSGVLMIKGEAFPCDLVAPHDGWGHANTAAEAVWQ